MEFYRGNKIDGKFEQPVADVADEFVTWYWGTAGAAEAVRDHMPLERVLRWWLTAAEYFNSVWETEHGPESFDELWDRVRAKIFELMRAILQKEEDTDVPT